MKCAATHGQIQRDLSKLPVIDLNRLRTEGYERFNGRDVCHYSVINGKVWFQAMTMKHQADSSCVTFSGERP